MSRPDDAPVTWSELREAVEASLQVSSSLAMLSLALLDGDPEAAERAKAAAETSGDKLNRMFGPDWIAFER